MPGNSQMTCVFFPLMVLEEPGAEIQAVTAVSEVMACWAVVVAG
jgi:hypothetical protein